jgi:hypothetical protein
VKNDYPRLCGGTFLSLVLQALKQRTNARGHIVSERDGLSNPEVLSGLIRVINPDFKKPNKDTFETNTSSYIKCKISRGAYFPFDEPATIDYFDKRVKNDYQAVLTHMSDFVNTFIEVGTAVGKDVRLVKALIELIAADESIGGQEQFYSCENGHFLTKTDLVGVQEVCLPAFLLGIWHYILINRKENTVGIETYNRWHKAPEECRGKWTFIGPNGASITRDIKVNFRSEPVENIASADEPLTSEQSSDSRGPSLSPVIPSDNTDPKRITVNNYGTVQNQKFISIETMNGDINL